MENAKLIVAVADNGTVTVTDKQSGAVYAGLNAYENTGDIGNEYVYRQPEGSEVLTTEGLTAEISIEEQSPSRVVMQTVLRWEVPASADETFLTEKQQMVPFTERNAGRSEQMVSLVLTTHYTLEAGSGMLQVSTSFNNQAKDQRLRALFLQDSKRITTMRTPSSRWPDVITGQRQNGSIRATPSISRYSSVLQTESMDLPWRTKA